MKWLLKSEPSTYSWEDLEKEGKTTWDGIRNYAARNHLRDMKKGDEAFFYYSGGEPQVMGIVKIVKEAFQDPTTDEDAWVAVEISPVKKLAKPVPMSVIKKDKRLKEMALVRISRLSVQPVTDAEWKIILELSRS